MLLGRCVYSVNFVILQCKRHAAGEPGANPGQGRYRDANFICNL